jgi:hypothetical protein
MATTTNLYQHLLGIQNCMMQYQPSAGTAVVN